jgi:hypothetical protein
VPGRPSKSLRDLVRDGSFLARRHEKLLDSHPVPWPGLAALQERYLGAGGDVERRAIAREFEAAVIAAHQASAEASSADRGPTLEQEMLKLGPHGSARQAVRFFPRFLVHDDGKPWVLDRWQQDMIRETFRRDEIDGVEQRVYKEILWGLSRGLGKTPLASGLGLCALLSRPGRPRIFQGAGSKDQAALGLAYASNWIGESDELADWLKAGVRNVLRRDGRGSYSILSAAGNLGHGRKPDVGIIDEEWAFTTAAQEQTKTALETALHKLLDSYLLSISTAGHSKASLLGRSFDAFMKLDDIRTYRGGFLTVARDREAGRLMWWYGMPEGYELDLENDEGGAARDQALPPGLVGQPRRDPAAASTA